MIRRGAKVAHQFRQNAFYQKQTEIKRDFDEERRFSGASQAKIVEKKKKRKGEEKRGPG